MANVATELGCKRPLRNRARFNASVAHFFADAGWLVSRAERQAHIVLEVVKRRPSAEGFAVVCRRWVVERPFAWSITKRRLAGVYAQLTSLADTLITIAATPILLRRWP